MMLTLVLEAPFAVCRTFTAGWYRPTATFLSPSMVYGLLLNFAGIETRLREEEADHPGNVPASLMRSGLPKLRLALGKPESSPYPTVTTLYQQLHNYPVGNSGQERASTTFGNKYNITPVRRELLSKVAATIAVEADERLEEAIREGLAGRRPSRYGLPFLGDNSFLPDRVSIVDPMPATHWYERIGNSQEKIRPRTTRLTVWIDRADLSRTRSDLFAPSTTATTDIPAAAWVSLDPP